MALSHWQHLDEDVSKGRLDRVQSTLGLVTDALCDLVPCRRDIHARIRADCAVADRNTQRKLIEWIQRFQAPIYNAKTAPWLKRARQEPMPISEFLYLYLPHLQLCLRQAREYRAQVGTRVMETGR